MGVVQQLEPDVERSPLAAARIHRKLTIEETARRAGLSVEQVEWLEAGRAYRFPSADAALVAAVVYATALGIDQREARAIAGLPVPPAPAAYGKGRIAAAAVATAAAVALLLTVLPLGGGSPKRVQAKPLPPPWRIAVDVLNGGGDINYTRQVASRVGALGYRIERVTRANRFDYPETAVYYEPGGEAIAQRLANQLNVEVRPLPGGANRLRLVVIAGPPRALG
jgi:transcriptional regulator with XRE-family HTH domain